jgi:hypothetical protein
VTRADAQRHRALKDANRSRLARSAIWHELAAGTLTLADVVEQRPEALLDTPLFEVLKHQRRFGARRLIVVNHYAVEAGVNLAKSFGEVPRETLDWLVTTVAETGYIASGGKPPPAATRTAPNPVAPAPVPAATEVKGRWPLQGVVGFYRTADGTQRRLVLTLDEDRHPILVDRNGTEERLVETFTAQPGLLEVAAVASGYLDEARKLQRPVSAA